MGEVETVERTRDRGVAVTVYFGQRKASASTADLQPASLVATVEQACAIAKFTEADPAAGLADAGADGHASCRDFDQWHPWDIDAERRHRAGAGSRDRAAAKPIRASPIPTAPRSTPAQSMAAYANSHGFLGFERSTSHSISCSLIAGRDDGMQRDYWYSTALAADDLESPAASAAGPPSAPWRGWIRGRSAPASSRCCSRRKWPAAWSATCSARCPAARCTGAPASCSIRSARSYSRTGSRSSRIPSSRRGFRSSAFDAEGVATRQQDLVRDGVLSRYVLGSYSARKLGLATTANAGGVHNLKVASNASDGAALMRDMGTGLLVTELMGQGVNTITGDYSRGAAGFWVEGGEIRHAVDEITIAGNLRDMFRSIEAVGADVDTPLACLDRFAAAWPDDGRRRALIPT